MFIFLRKYQLSSTTILFGNGLGMSIDPEYFTINKAVETVWATLDDNNKEILKLDIQRQPKTEDGSERHQQIADACKPFQNMIICTSNY